MDKTKKRKRLKRVFKNASDCIEVYAKQSQHDGRAYYKSRQDGSRDNIRCYFEGRDLYSYGRHYLLARTGLEINGVKVAVVNFTYYSSKTSGDSRDAARELKANGHFVVDARADDAWTIKEGITDAELVKLAVQTIENESYRLDLEFFKMGFEARCGWWLKDTVKTAHDHNELCDKLRLPHLKVKIRQDNTSTARRLWNAQRKADRDHESRNQVRFFKTDSYRSRRVEHRRTA